jgi:hypothetical protein
MNKQPETLRLIGQLDEIATYSSKSATWALDAVNELDRLYAVNQELVEALKHLLHNAKASGAEMGLALDVAEAALKNWRTYENTNP